MEMLPLQEMRRLWKNKNYRQYLWIFNHWLFSSRWRAYHFQTDQKRKTIREQAREALGRLTNLWKSHNPEIHGLIQSIYLSSVRVESGTIRDLQVRSYNEYLRRILCTEVMRFANIWIPRFIDLFQYLLEGTFLDQQTLKVEDNLRQYNERSSADGKGYICALQRISVEFMETLYIYPLNYCQYPTRAGVYFIYYIGKTALYSGVVKPSIATPIYVGKSKKSISTRLNDHRKMIDEAPDLEVDDFIFRFMLVDIKHYAVCIEEMLIDYLKPKWNKEWGRLCFGNAKGKGNGWNKYHIQGIRFSSDADLF